MSSINPYSNITRLDDYNWGEVEAVELDSVSSLNPEEVIAGAFIKGTDEQRPLSKKMPKIPSKRNALSNSIDEKLLDKTYRDLPSSKRFTGDLIKIVDKIDNSGSSKDEKKLELKKIRTTLLNFALLQRTTKDIKNFADKIEYFEDHFDTYFPGFQSELLLQFKEDISKLQSDVRGLWGETNAKPLMSSDLDLKNKPIGRSVQRLGRGGRGRSVSMKSEEKVEKAEKNENRRQKASTSDVRRSRTESLASRVRKSAKSIFSFTPIDL